MRRCAFHDTYAGPADTYRPQLGGRVQTESAEPPGALPGHLLTAIDHVGVAVWDLDAAIRFYSDKFGLEVAHQEVNEQMGVREAMLPVGESGSCIQLMAPLTPDSAIAKFLDRRGQGIQQLAYRVVDIQAASEVLRSRGVRLLYDEPQPGTAGSLVNFVHPRDGGGVLVELVEPNPQPAEFRRTT
jgi:methylmalonyl-CoA/ethylmalonyl-CoA epimerase